MYFEVIVELPPILYLSQQLHRRAVPANKTAGPFHNFGYLPEVWCGLGLSVFPRSAIKHAWVQDQT